MLANKSVQKLKDPSVPMVTNFDGMKLIFQSNPIDKFHFSFTFVHSNLALKKMVVNHIDKTFVTSDAATILKELEVQHPAAKMLQMACKMQEE